MSLRSLNSPPLVAVAGLSTLVGIPFLETLTSSAPPLVFKTLNIAAFALNIAAVSIPGRLDGQQHNEMRKGYLNPKTKTTKKDNPLIKDNEPPSYILNKSRTLVNPSGWAFTIWGPIYLGEAAFVTTQLLASDTTFTTLNTILPNVTVPFVAANIFQSLWCASFRPSYEEGWKKYISVGMLGGTAYSLFLASTSGQAAIILTGMANQTYLLYPLIAHFGWTSAATLVNLNGSIGSDKSVSPRIVVAVGHSSAVLATALGIGITLANNLPVYGLTLSWALAACADGMSKRTNTQCSKEEKILASAGMVQEKLCLIGSALCAIASAYVCLQ